MRRLLATVLIALLPLAAMAQWAPNQQPDARTATYGVLALAPTPGDSGVVVPLWQSADGRLLALVADSDSPSAPAGASPRWDLHLVDASAFMSTGVRWDISPHLYTRAGVNRWATVQPLAADCDAVAAHGAGSACDTNRIPAWLGGEVGGGFRNGSFNVDVGISWLNRGAPMTASPADTSVGYQPGLYGIPGNLIDSLDGLNASGSMQVGDGGTRLSLGASIGRLQLLPGSVVGLDAIDKKALSFGVGHGSISGVVVGRVMQPVAGLYGADGALGQDWNAIDLGFTWRLPWQGELSVGAQNVWSSHQVVSPQAPLDPAQHRMPYIQYHQDL
ncbi:MAG TPA: hypothetical protein VFG73_09740 [Rhodanobacteraceae bacterium]|nr:hypothetical protein [Rhodanobacteraceae bacterium]